MMRAEANTTYIWAAIEAVKCDIEAQSQVKYHRSWPSKQERLWVNSEKWPVPDHRAAEPRSRGAVEIGIRSANRPHILAAETDSRKLTALGMAVAIQISSNTLE